MLKQNSKYTNELISSLVDFTSLDDHKNDDIEGMVHTLNIIKEKPASLCTWADHLHRMDDLKNVRKTIVLNFPNGDKSLELLENEIKMCVKHNVDEVDYVINWKSWIQDKKHETMKHFEAFIKMSDGFFTKKVILESGQFNNKKELSKLCLDILSYDCVEYLKTSTGKTEVGATVEDTNLILDAIIQTQSNCGLKVSGGIRSVEQAMDFMNLVENKMSEDWLKSKFRIGASGLYSKLIGHSSEYANY